MTNKLAENIKKYRKLANLSQKDLAVFLHRAPNVISNWERGVNSPEVDAVLSMCDLFHCNPNEIFGYEESEEFQLLVEMENLEKRKSDLEARISEYASRIASKKQDNSSTT